MSKLPKRFAKFAPYLAAANPIAFANASVALASLSRSFDDITQPNVVGTRTGGYYFHKDSDGDISLWINPEIIWKEL